MNPQTASIQIKKISSLTQEILEQTIPGYTSDKMFRVKKLESDRQISFSLSLEELDKPFVKHHDYSDPSILADYNSAAKQGLAYGAFNQDRCVGFIVGEVQSWNSSLVVREFGVHPEARYLGIGRALIERIFVEAQGRGLQSVFCETQNTNFGAIEFYKKLGFSLEGVDLSFYRAQDVEVGEVAVFFRKQIEALNGVKK